MTFEEQAVYLSSVELNRLRGKRVLVRADLNLPLTAEGSVDLGGDWRLRAIVPTIHMLRQGGATIILLGHLGRPGGAARQELTLSPIARRLSDLLRQEIILAPGVAGPDVDAVIGSAGDAVVMLENVRFDPGEEKNDIAFAKRLARMGDVYVNDAFAASHRRHASLMLLPTFLPSLAGLLMEKEMTALNDVLANSAHPFVVILGGAKIATKAPVVQRFIGVADSIILVGALANSILAARGTPVGASSVESVPDRIVRNDELLLPQDVVAASSLYDAQGNVVGVRDIPSDAVVVDIGPATIRGLRPAIEKASLVVWNGPAGFIENDSFASGTRALADLLAASSARVVVGGGDTVGYLQRKHLLDVFDHVSTGGGAMLEYLARGTLPGIQALQLSPSL